MAAIYWQIGISLSIIGTYFILNRQATNEYLSPERGLKLISIAWVVWTILGPLGGNISPLVIVQFLNIYISYTIAKKFLKKDIEAEQLKSTINQLKQDLKNIDNRRLNKSYKKFIDSITPIIGAQSHRNLLLNSLNEAQETLVILSGWATDYAINDEFKNLVRNCLDRGVQIYIGYGYQMKKSGIKISSVKKLETESVFKELQEWCAEYEKKGRINVWYYPNHSKVLICDKKYIVCGSFNWLSNIGNSQNEERSYKIENKDFIEQEHSEIINSLHSPLKATKRQLLKLFHKWSDY